jgi:mannitol-1-phosphate 5-dehydrogenase
VEDARCGAALRACDAVFVSVRGENGLAAGAWLSERIAQDQCVVAAENATVPASLLGGQLAGRAASGAVFCTTIEDGPLDILSENYPSLHVSAKGTSDAVAALGGVCVERDFDTLMLRKIYTYNAASAIIAYLGAEKGYASYAEAANDAEIAKALDAFYEEINRAICLEYGVPPEEQARFAGFSKAKFQNRAIADTVARNAASPLRKLGAKERIVAPMRLIEKRGGDAEVLIRTAVAALRYARADDAEKILRETCGLGENSRLFRDIREMWARGAGA